MRRRRVLQMGATLATLPFTGCGATTPDSASPSASATTPSRPPDEVPHGPAPVSTSASSGDAAASAPPVDSSAPAASAPPPDPPKTTFSRVIGKVGKNHGHVLAVAFADVQAGAEKTYDIAGASTHPHKVTLSADHMKKLAAGDTIRMKSTRDNQHAHRVLVKCAPAVDPPEWITVCTAEFSGQDEHELVIPAADMAAKSDRTYDIQGIADHPHQITVKAADFEKLLKGEAISVLSTRYEEDAHLHTVFIRYRPPKA